jgi:hypothetical protein
VSFDLALPNQLVHEFGAALDLSGGFLDGQHKNPPFAQYGEKRIKGQHW